MQPAAPHLQVLHKGFRAQQARVAAGAAPVGGAAAALLAQQRQTFCQLAHALLPLLRTHRCGLESAAGGAAGSGEWEPK